MSHKNHNFNPVLLNAGLACHDADWNYNNISNPFFRIYLVMEGGARLEINQMAYDLKPGKLYLIPPFSVHNDSCSGIFSLYYIHVFENQKNAISLFEQYHFPVEVEADDLAAQLIGRLIEINPERELLQYDPELYTNDLVLMNGLARSEQTPLPAQMETKGILSVLFSRFFGLAVETSINNDNRIWNAVHYIRDNIHTRIRIPDLANACNVSEDHLIRLFKKELNMTPIAYVNKKKIEKAQLMLVLEHSTIKEVACSLAFDNISYFNKVFKAQLGKTPSDYLKITPRKSSGS
ncbi:MAG: hypothetical protein RIS29_3031 [Bacteroidota bacterium]|jgi:AraC-like DNA-binding protein